MSQIGKIEVVLSLNIPTIGDNIRKNNETLVNMLIDYKGCNYCIYQNTDCIMDDIKCKQGILKFINQLTMEGIKQCVKI